MIPNNDVAQKYYANYKKAAQKTIYYRSPLILNVQKRQIYGDNYVIPWDWLELKTD